MTYNLVEEFKAWIRENPKRRRNIHEQRIETFYTELSEELLLGKTWTEITSRFKKQKGKIKYFAEIMERISSREKKKHHLTWPNIIQPRKMTYLPNFLLMLFLNNPK